MYHIFIINKQSIINHNILKCGMTCFLSKHDARRDEYLGKIREMTGEIFLHTTILKSNRAAEQVTTL